MEAMESSSAPATTRIRILAQHVSDLETLFPGMTPSEAIGDLLTQYKTGGSNLGGVAVAAMDARIRRLTLSLAFLGASNAEIAGILRTRLNRRIPDIAEMVDQFIPQTSEVGNEN